MVQQNGDHPKSNPRREESGIFSYATKRRTSGSWCASSIAAACTANMGSQASPPHDGGGIVAEEGSRNAECSRNNNGRKASRHFFGNMRHGGSRPAPGSA